MKGTCKWFKFYPQLSTLNDPPKERRFKTNDTENKDMRAAAATSKQITTQPPDTLAVFQITYLHLNFNAVSLFSGALRLNLVRVRQAELRKRSASQNRTPMFRSQSKCIDRISAEVWSPPAGDSVDPLRVAQTQLTRQASITKCGLQLDANAVLR